MRIPYEGMLASWTPDGIPLVVSTWGNDLTLHARGSRWMDSATRQTLHRTDGLVSDTQRDLKLAQEWGFDPQKPALEVPGSGGVNLEEVRAAKSAATPLPSEWLDGRPIIVNPRGIRPGSVRTDTFFKAIPHVLERIPRAAFACPSMAGQPEAIQWVTRLGLQEQVCLLPLIPQSQLWRLYDDSQVLVSVSEHDGTPNSVLEGMACGCFPVAGDIDSMREWIEPGVNGLLVPPGDETALAQAIYTAIEDSKLRSQAAERNLQLVTTRAETTQVMLQVEHFYQTVLNLPR
jgi:glycosyltransferase involved in cell wall biosynthesis